MTSEASAGATGVGQAGGDERAAAEARLESMSEAKRLLFEKRLVRRRAENDDTIVPVPRTEALPLSSAQRRLWFMDQLSPGSAMFNVSVALRFSGPLRLDLLAQSVRRLFLRHEALRTVFTAADGEPVQRIRPDVEVDLTPVPLPCAGPGDADLEPVLREAAARPFSLERGPLARAQVFGRDPADHVLLLTVHHSVCDGWSMSVLVDELLELYSAAVAGREASLKPLPLQYADYAAWEARPERAAELADGLAYWRHKLDGAIPVIELPLDRPRPSAQSFRGARHRFTLPTRIWPAVKELAREERVTPFMVLLAGFAALLSRYSGQGEISVSTPVANRPRVELETMVGFFANSIVLRIDTSGAPTFRELARRVREVAQEGIAHSAVPFDAVVEAVDPPRSLSHAPLAQVLFALVDNPGLDVTAGDLRVTTVDHHTGTAKYDLSLELWPDADGVLHGVLEYAADLFEPATVADTAAHLGTLLDSLTHAPDGTIADARLLSDEELREIVVDWNRTDDPLLGETYAHELFERQARRTPDAPALVSGDRTLTFAELSRRADRLTARLRGAGVKPETRIGLFLERDVELVVAVLAALKAGGTYVPLDVSDPAERVAFMLADADTQIVITTRARRESLPETGAHVLLADDDRPDRPDQPEQPVPQEHAEQAQDPRPHPESASYIIYTSGSTGRPKGAVVTHRGLTNYLAWALTFYRVADGGGAPLVSPLRFDLSVTTLFCPLLAGRPVVLVREGEELDMLAKSLGADRLEFGLVKLTPAHLEALDKALPPATVEAEGYLVAGGESLHGSTVAAWRERAPGLRVVNEYGPTETVVGCCVHEVDEHTDLSGTVPIGRPIANTRLYVLDANLAPVPRGAVGELYVGGAGVARGYRNRPDLTAERFLPDPFSTTPGARLYRTGDLARMRADGELECLGRVDTQVKVRGYRVELEEIEATLTRLDAVREAVVLLRKDLPGEARLVAYVTTTATGTPGLEAGLRTELRRDLPDYMVPDVFVVLDALPLAANGKVDRTVLPRPTAAGPEAGSEPATPIEQIIAEVWSEVLGVPSVSREANFLEAGGHSLLAVQAMARLRKALDLDLPLTVFLEATSLADLATRVETLGGKAPRAGLVPAPRTSPAPLSYAQGRLYFLNRLAQDSSFYNVPMALRFDGELRAEALGQAFAALWARHEGLRTCFPSLDGEPVQEILPADAVPYEEVDLRSAPRERLDALMNEEARTPFDLARGPLLRGRLVRLGSGAHVLLMTLHHTVSDGWSLDILLNELMALYRAFAKGEPSPLAPLPYTYLDYTMWQRSWLAGADLEAQLGYWKRQLADAPMLELPTDRPRPPVQSFRGARHEISWSGGLARAIGELARREGVSLFMALLAGFDVLMARLSGQRDITVGTPIANRTLTELEGIVGFFANTLALRVDLSGDPTFSEVLRRVREVAYGAYAHQDVPFEMVVDAVAPARSLSHSPLFQVRFALQNAVGGLPDPGEGLTLTVIDNEQRTARFDLVVDLWETEDGIEGHAEYSTDLFDAGTIARLMARLETLFERLVRDPGQRVFEVDIMLPGERESLAELSRGTYTGGQVHTFAQRFAEQAGFRPEDPAVTCGPVTLSYGELRRRSVAVAAALRARGVGPESMVAVYFERSADLVVAVLGVLEAGAAYVPLDPAYPAERVAAVVADARPALVLTSRALAATAPAGERLLLEDAEAETHAARPAAPLPEHPAYVVYTSGTKGRPKGVVVTQGGLAAYLDALPAALPLPGEPVFLHTASFAFSSSVRQLAVPLSRGGRVVIAGRDQLASPETLLAYAAEHGVNVLDLVPSYLRVVEPALARLDGWRPSVVLTASEPLLYELPEALRRLPGEPIRLVNMYGQTETTGIVAAAPIAAEREGRGAVVPLGRPIPGTRLHVVDEALRPVPVGHPGEIVVDGPGLARGYLGDPALTAERFVASPFGPPGSRLYRTGDRGRFLPSGKVEFLGRLGDQVKIRGHRVEPDEVASVLGALDGVAECVVLCHEDAPDERRLVAYVALRPGGAATVERLRATLTDQLPDYMIPALVPVDAVPRLPNGKADRVALRAMEVTTAETEDDAPRGATEETLAAIWQDVLRLPAVGRRDGFFALGGDSLHVIRVVDRARKAGVAITPAQLIANPTVADLAAVAAQAGGTATKVETGGTVPLVPSHHAFLRRDFADKHLYTHIFIFDTLRPLDPKLMEQAVAHVIAHHESLRIGFPREGDAYRVKIQNSFDRTPFTSVDLSALDPAAQDAAFARLDRTLHRKLDYAGGPLLHVALVRFGAGRPDRFVAIVHHQLMDNSSWGVLLEDLQTAYLALVDGVEPWLEPPTSSFAAWARSMNELARSADLDEDVAYWTALAERPVPRLPLDHEGGDNLMSSEETVVVGLDADDTAALRRTLPREYGLTLNDGLLAAMLRGYADWSGQRSILLDLVGRGRELGGDDLDLSRAIGRFSMTSPRLLDLPEEEGPRALLRSVAAQVRAVPRGGLGFGLLRYLGTRPEVARRLAPLGQPGILLSNWGEFEGPAEESPLLGPPVEDGWEPPRIARMYALTVHGRISGGKLTLTFRFSASLHDRERVERLAGLVENALRSFARTHG
ncbi:non-ribosomal peptide synthetase [Microbispora sp. H13382]|uniref:non-ribosomal peptide synthetase n=1 Tax=Microbispora sp. H13382 TaxID=2729112 RepID=UPI001600A53A|nr:non-ribosomal peptide synthetase [Microbispora sp. H13382]